MNQTLKQQLITAAQNPSHCYIFAGPIGSGKMAAAQDLAQQLVSRDHVTQSHNITMLAAETSGRMIKIDQVRDVITQLMLKPLEQDQKRVVIIAQAHDMTPEGVNSLLKILEEPSEGVIFILVSSRLASILPTIRSRAQIIRFNTLLNPQIASNMSERAKSFLTSSLAERFVIAKQAHEQMQNNELLGALFEASKQGPDRFILAPFLLHAEAALMHNVNGRLVFEWLAMETST